MYTPVPHVQQLSTTASSAFIQHYENVLPPKPIDGPLWREQRGPPSGGARYESTSRASFADLHMMEMRAPFLPTSVMSEIIFGVADRPRTITRPATGGAHLPRSASQGASTAPSMSGPVRGGRPSTPSAFDSHPYLDPLTATSAKNVHRPPKPILPRNSPPLFGRNPRSSVTRSTSADTFVGNSARAPLPFYPKHNGSVYGSRDVGGNFQTTSQATFVAHSVDGRPNAHARTVKAFVVPPAKPPRERFVLS